MIRLWAKIMVNNKIKKDAIYEEFAPLSATTFYDCLTEICHKFDISTPVVIAKHYENFCEFNHVKFLPRDFIDSVSFDSLIIENALI